MRKIESVEDERNGVVIYELPDGRWIRLDRNEVREFGAAQILQRMGITELPTKRVAVWHGGRRVGTVPADFDPMFMSSGTFMYDPRSCDFRREGDHWIASDTLGPGDLDAVSGFVRE